MKLGKFVIVFIFLFFSIYSFSQENKKLIKKLHRKARNFLLFEDFDSAKEIFKELAEMDTSDFDINFEAGLSYFYSSSQQTQAKKYFERALRHTEGKDTIPDIYYYLARINQMEGNFDKSKKLYSQFKTKVKNNKQGEILKETVENQIENVETAKKIVTSSVLVENIRPPQTFKNIPKDNIFIDIFPLNEPINTPYPDYTPLVNEEENLLFITSRNENTTKGKIYSDGLPYEDIYIFQKNENGIWQDIRSTDNEKLKNLLNILNTKKHDAIIDVLFNGKDVDKVVFYRKNNIFETKYENNQWTKPRIYQYFKKNKLKNFSLEKKYIPSVFVSPDHKYVLFVSDQLQGEGGKDIYVSFLQKDGVWSAPKNLGPKINTPYDEDAPYVSRDGKTLYFASKGHLSIGGYDIFKSILQPDSTWGEPINVGAPINSTFDDIFISLGNDNAFGYIASSRIGSMGYLDIYRFHFDCMSIEKTHIKGIVLAGIKQYHPVTAEIIATEEETGEKEHFKTDKYGKFNIYLSPEFTYNIEFRPLVKGLQTQFFKIYIPKQCREYNLYSQFKVTITNNTNNIPIAQKTEFTLLPADMDSLSSDLFSNKNFNPKSNKSIYGDLYSKSEYDTLFTYVEAIERNKEFYNDRAIKLIDSIEIPLAIAEEQTKQTTNKEVEVAIKDELSNIKFPVLYFAFNKYTLDKENITKLNEVLKILSDYENLKIEITGHTDAKGRAGYNKNLSLQRAKTVYNYLLSKGINKNRMIYKGYGEAYPLADNCTTDGKDNPAGRSKNRRVELYVEGKNTYNETESNKEIICGKTVKKEKELVIIINDAVICKNIKNREPVLPATEFSKDVTRLYCFTAIQSTKAQGKIYHIWYYGDKIMTKVPLTFYSSSNWRTWSSKNIMKEWTGNWKVEIVDENNNVLKEIKFVIK